jgi:hypothetical protein
MRPQRKGHSGIRRAHEEEGPSRTHRGKGTRCPARDSLRLARMRLPIPSLLGAVSAEEKTTEQKPGVSSRVIIIIIIQQGGSLHLNRLGCLVVGGRDGGFAEGAGRWPRLYQARPAPHLSAARRLDRMVRLLLMSSPCQSQHCWHCRKEGNGCLRTLPHEVHLIKSRRLGWAAAFFGGRATGGAA